MFILCQRPHPFKPYQNKIKTIYLASFHRRQRNPRPSALAFLVLSALLWPAPSIADRKKVNFSEEIPAGDNYTDMDFSKNKSIPKGIFKRKNLEDSLFSHSDLRESSLDDATNLRFVTFKKCKLPRNALANKNLEGASFIKMNLEQSGLGTATNLTWAKFINSTLPKGALAGKDLSDVSFIEVDLSQSALENATNLRKVKFSKCILPKDSLKAKDLRGVEFAEMDLTQAGLGSGKGSNLQLAHFTKTQLPPHALSKKDLWLTSFSEMDLRESGIENASSLENTRFNEVQLPENALSGLKVTGAVFNKMDLSQSGLESATDLQNIKLADVIVSSEFLDLERVNPDTGVNEWENENGITFNKIQMTGKEFYQLIQLKKELRIREREWKKSEHGLKASLRKIQAQIKLLNRTPARTAGIKVADWKVYLEPFSSINSKKWNKEYLSIFVELLKGLKLDHHPFFVGIPQTPISPSN